MTGASRQLSVGQEALWFLYRMAPQSPAYNIMLAVRIRGDLDEPALARAVTAVSARHDLLRSVFHEEDGVPVRVVRDDLTPLRVRDVGALTDPELAALAADAGAEPFPLGTGGPFRVVLLRRAGGDAALVVVTHHIVSDAISQWLVLRDLLRAYAAGGTPLAPLTVGYDDFVTEERRLLASPRGERMARYWRDTCTGTVAAELRPDRPRPAVATTAGATHLLHVPDDVARDLRTAAANAGITPFAFLLGVFESLLFRYTAQDDFVVGCPAATRYSRGMRDVVGYLVNSLVLRARFGPATTFADAVASAHRQLIGGMAHVGHPFALLARELDPPRARTRTPLFRIAFTMVATERLDPPLPLVPEGQVVGSEIAFGGLRLAVFDLPQLEGQFDLSVEMRQSGTGLTGAFRFNTDLFDLATIERFTGHFLRLLRAAVADPAAPVARVSLMDGAALRHLLAFGTGTTSDPPGRDHSRAPGTAMRTHQRTGMEDHA